MALDQDIENLLDIAIKEDFRTGDVATNVCVPESALLSGKFVMKQAGVIAGLPFLIAIMQKVDPRIQVELLVSEGSYQKAGTIIGTIAGPARGILSTQTIALNIVKHTSGIASMTAAYVKRLKGLDCVILDTRKTLPGLRAIEKYAVKVGGGKNHRFGLDDRFILKANHLSFFAHAASPVKEAVTKAKQCHPELPIEVEIDSLEKVKEALKTDVEAIFLYHMTPEEIKACVKLARQTGKKIYVESSVGVTLETVKAYAETGVNGISVAEVTDSAPSINIILKINRPAEEMAQIKTTYTDKEKDYVFNT